MTVAERRPRLRSEDRREQLLDAAKEELLERGVAGLTMEGIAARAGVNKALPYRHFENAQAVLLELFIRFTTILGAQILEAVGAHERIEDRVRATVAAYFDVVRDHQTFLAVTLNVDTDIASAAAIEMGAEEFAATLMVTSFGVNRREAAVTADILLGVLASAAETWGRGKASRRRIEELAVTACLAMIERSSTA